MEAELVVVPLGRRRRRLGRGSGRRRRQGSVVAALVVLLGRRVGAHVDAAGREALQGRAHEVVAQLGTAELLFPLAVIFRGKFQSGALVRVWHLLTCHQVTLHDFHNRYVLKQLLYVTLTYLKVPVKVYKLSNAAIFGVESLANIKLPHESTHRSIKPTTK